MQPAIFIDQANAPGRRCEVLRQQRIARVVVEFRCHRWPFQAAAVFSNSVVVPRVRHHLLTQYTTVRFSQAAERRQHSASGVSPRNRSRDGTSRRAATENAIKQRSSFRKCAETIYRVSMPGWHVHQLAKGVTHEPRPSQAQGCARRKAVSHKRWLTPAATCCRCSAAYRDDAVVGLATKRSLNAEWTARHNTAGVAVPCLPFLLRKPRCHPGLSGRVPRSAEIRPPISKRDYVLEFPEIVFRTASERSIRLERRPCFTAASLVPGSAVRFRFR